MASGRNPKKGMTRRHALLIQINEAEQENKRLAEKIQVYENSIKEGTEVIRVCNLGIVQTSWKATFKEDIPAARPKTQSSQCEELREKLQDVSDEVEQARMYGENTKIQEEMEVALQNMKEENKVLNASIKGDAIQLKEIWINFRTQFDSDLVSFRQEIAESGRAKEEVERTLASSVMKDSEEITSNSTDELIVEAESTRQIVEKKLSALEIQLAKMQEEVKQIKENHRKLEQTRNDYAKWRLKAKEEMNDKQTELDELLKMEVILEAQIPKKRKRFLLGAMRRIFKLKRE